MRLDVILTNATLCKLALQMKDVELKRAITDLESMTEARYGISLFTQRL